MAEPEFEMEDGTLVRPEVINNAHSGRGKRCLKRLLERMYDRGDMIVGIDTEWELYGSNYRTEPRVALLKLCNQGCVVLLHAPGKYLTRFCASDDIVFAGVHLNKRLELLRKDWGMNIRNAVDLSEMAVDVLHQPRLRAFGVRGLASEVLCQPWKPRPLSMTLVNWDGTLDDERIECATVDAYATYKIANKLLSRNCPYLLWENINKRLPGLSIEKSISGDLCISIILCLSIISLWASL